MTRIELPTPLLGLNRNFRLSEQPIQTSRDLSNVRPIDGTTGRQRLAVRPGLTPFFSGTLGGAGNKVQALGSAGYQSRHVSYAADTIPDELWAYTFTSGGAASNVVAGKADDSWTIENSVTLRRLSRYGVQLGSINIPRPSGTSTIHSINTLAVSEDGFACYVATTDYTGGSPLPAGTKIWKVVVGADGTSLSILWELTPGTTGRFIPRMHEYQGVLYTIENRVSATDFVEVAAYVDLDNPQQGVGGSRSLIATVDSTPLAAVGGSGWSPGDAVYAHDMALQTNGGLWLVCAVAETRDPPSTHTGNVAQFRIDTSGTFQDTYFLPRTGFTNIGGFGWGCDVDTVGSVISCGQIAADDVWVRKVVDTGGGWSTVAGWVRTAAQDLGGAGNNQAYAYPRLEIDNFGNSAIPTARSNASVTAARIFTPAGVLYTSIQHRVGVTPTNTNNECRACCWPSSYPNYLTDDYKIGTQVNVAGTAVQTLLSGTNTATVHGYDIVQETAVANPSRAVSRFGVAGGNVYRFTSSGPTSPTNNTARTPPFATLARFIQFAVYAGKVYITDGLSYGVYDPQPTVASPDGILSNWAADSLGLIPPQARLICRWRNRIVLAHTADSPYAWHMSAFNNPNNWDLGPPEPLETQAVSGTALDAAGNAPQVIQALIPWSDALLFIGCEKCILRLDGDPMAGGRMSVVSDETGMAFGSPWAKDPEGRVFFFGSRGGVYAMTTAGEILWLTKDTIEADLADIDLLSNYVTLHWDHAANGLHLFVMPYGSGGTHLRHYFWSSDTKGWFPQEFGSIAFTGIQPTAACILDGDESADRVFLIGTEDGRVLRFDENASNDGGYPIDSRCLIGPIAGMDVDAEMKFSRPSVVLASELGGAFFKFFASDTPETPQLPRDEYRVGPGRNQQLPVRARGRFVWAQVRAASRVTAGVASHSERYAIESINVNVAQGGRARVRQ